MFANPEEAALQLRQLLGTEGSLVIASASDGNILAGELRLGHRFYNSIEPTSLFDILAPWQRHEFRLALSNMGTGWQEKGVRLFGQDFKTLFLKLDFGRGSDAVAIHFKPVNASQSTDTSNLSFLLKAGVKAAVLYPQGTEIIWLTGQETEKSPGLEEEFSMDEPPAFRTNGISLSGIDIKAIMQVAAGTGQSFQAQNIWSETEGRYFDVEVWAVLDLGHVQCVNAVLIPSRKMPHQQRVLSAAGVYAAFSTNPFGRKPAIHIEPNTAASAKKLTAFLLEGNPDFLDYCRSVTELGHGQMDLSMLNGHELILESSLEVTPGNQQGLFHLIRVPFLERAVAEEAEDSTEKEVELLLKESNHRIKNSISLAASLLQIQASELKSDKARAALSDSVNRMHTIAQLHEAIYRQLQQDKMLDVKPYLEDILDRLRKSVSSKKIIFKWDIESHNLPTGTAGTLGMLVNEIVQNSLKHAFKDNGKGLVGVSFYRIENMYYLSAEDNGGGDPDSKSWKETDSLGSSLIEEFVSQLGGKVRLERQTGTRYLITFHAPNE